MVILKKIINYIIYFKNILNIWMGQDGFGLEFYDPNPTQSAIKKNCCNPTQLIKL